MTVKRSSSFKKQFKKLPVKLRSKFKTRLAILLSDPKQPQLRVHALRGKRYKNCFSMDITGDIRAIFEYKDQRTTILFLRIGSHSQLY